MENNTDHDPEKMLAEGFRITPSQYDELATLDLMCNRKCSVYEVLRILKILGLI